MKLLQDRSSTLAVATKAIPQITIWLNGVIQPVTLTEHEWVTIQLLTVNPCPNTPRNSVTTNARVKAWAKPKMRRMVIWWIRWISFWMIMLRMKKTHWIGSLRRSSQKNWIMSSVQLPTVSSCFIYSWSTSASTQFSQNVDQQSSRHKTFALMLWQKCTSSVISEGFVKCGLTCGRPGIIQMSGNFGISHPLLGSLSSEQPWLLRASGSSLNMTSCIIFCAHTWTFWSGF